MSDGEVEVIEVKASNSLVPNLTISIEKDEEGEVPMVEFEDEEDEKPDVGLKEENKDGVEFKVEAKSFPHTKIYENKFLKEMGLTVEEVKLRKQNRAKRFQSPMLRGEVEPVDNEAETVKKLIAHVDEINQTVDPLHMIRLDAVHLRGLNDMSTDDIFSFFNDLYPSHIEWIDDISCNVVWKDNESAATSLIRLAEDESQEEEKDKEESEPKNGVTEQESKPQQEEDDLDLMDSDEENMDVEDETKKKGPQKEKAKVDNKQFTNELRKCFKPFTKGDREVWLEMRLAADSDKKTLGGAKKSQYYRKYGNPNYGNMRGLLSRSFMKRYHGRVAKSEFEGYRPGLDETERSQDIEAKHESAIKTAAAKKRRMYSDQIEEGSKKSKPNDEEESETSSDSSEGEDEKEDRELMNSSAKDLADAIPSKPEEDFAITPQDTMRADRIAKKIEAARRSQEAAAESGTLNVSVRGNSVWARLGKVPPPEPQKVEVTVKNESRERQKRFLEQDKESSKKLPASLRDRLGSKRR